MRLRKAMRAIVGAGIVSGMIFGFAGPVQAATELVPFRMDASNQAGWWEPIDEFNGQVFVAYNAWGSASAGGSTDTHTVYIASKAPGGAWVRGCIKANATAACTVFGDDLGHYQPSIAVDGDGYIHAFVSMHNNDWRYYRSTAPGNVATMVRASMPDSGKFTYPNTARMNNGDVYLIVREYSSVGEGRLYRWNNAANTWSRVATFARDSSYVVYPDDVIGAANGDVHIAWEWASGGANGLRHYGSYVRYSPSTNRFYNAAGTQLTLPVTHTSPIVYQPIEGQETPTGRDHAAGVQSAKLALHPTTGRPIVAYRYKSINGASQPFRVKLAEWNGSSWVRSVVYGGAYNTFPAVDITTYGNSVRVYFAKNQTIADDHAHVTTRPLSGGTWTETLLLSGVPIERLAVTRRGTTDHLYLASPSTHALYYGTRNW